jgi:hypothetical protein
LDCKKLETDGENCNSEPTKEQLELYKSWCKTLSLESIMDNLIARNTTYSASFTTSAGGLYTREFLALLPYLESADIDSLLKLEVVENKLLQINAEKTRAKVIRQIHERLKFAFDGFWIDFHLLTTTQQSLKLFFLVLKATPLVNDLHFNVTLPVWKGSSREFDAFAIQMRLDEIGNEHENVRNYTENTRKEIIKIYRRILRQAGFLKGEQLVKPCRADEFFYPFIQNNETWFLEACFLNQAEREKLLTEYKRDQK